MHELSEIFVGKRLMYRQSLLTRNSRMNEEQFLTRLGNLPVVNMAWTQACGIYQKTKERNALFRMTLNAAETSVLTVAGTAKPLVEKCQPQIDRVNDYACQQLIKLEEKYPVIMQPPDQIVLEGKQACEALLKPTVDRVKAVRQYSADTYNGIVHLGQEQVNRVKKIGNAKITGMKDFGNSQIAKVHSYGQGVVDKTLATPYGQFVTSSVDGVLTMSEMYVDKYLPPSEEPAGEVVEKTTNPIVRVTTLSSKVRRRMYKKAMRDLRMVQLRSRETLSKLNFTVDLIEFAKKNIDQAKNRVENTWHKIILEQENEEAPQTFEDQTIAVARRLARQVKHSVNTVTTYVSSQPEQLKERMRQAQKFAEELYQSFAQAKNFQDIPSWTLKQAKDKVGYVQEALSFATDLLITTPLNWLVTSTKKESDMMEMSDLGGSSIRE